MRGMLSIICIVRCNECDPYLRVYTIHIGLQQFGLTCVRRADEVPIP